MPKSRLRKDRKPYKPYRGNSYAIEKPDDLFFHLHEMEGPERQAAAALLHKKMAQDEAANAVLATVFGDDWPPATPDDLIILSARVAAMGTDPNASLA